MNSAEFLLEGLRSVERRPEPAENLVPKHRTSGSSTERLVFTNKNYARTSSAGAGANQTKLLGQRSNSLQQAVVQQPIPSEVLDDICWRFLYNIPDNERNDLIRTCFQIEQAHWYYVDFFCKNKELKCPELGQRDFMKQVFCHCDYLAEYSSSVDQVLEQWRSYKSNVPTYGAILLDSSLDHVLLIQGYYARNSWGFPKGKLNESEESTVCAAREVEEEVGYDISEKISEKLFIQKFVNETLVRLYIITDVPADYPFAPKTRNEIGKIQWFSIWDLPTDRNDLKSSERIGYSPNNFYTALPFIYDLREYVSRQQKKRLKKPKNSGSLGSGSRSASAFDSVLSQQRLESLPPILGSLLPNLENKNMAQSTVGSNAADSPRDSLPPNAFFKPVASAPLSFTGPSFMELVSSNAFGRLHSEVSPTIPVARPVPTVPKPIAPVLGRPVYQAKKKSPVAKPLGDAASAQNKEAGAQRRKRRERNRKSGKESTSDEPNIVEEMQKTYENVPTVPFQGSSFPDILIKPCDAWQDFKLDLSRITFG